MTLTTGLIIKSAPWGTWTLTVEATASPHCYMKQDGFLCTSPQIMEPRLTELDPGSQVSPLTLKLFESGASTGVKIRCPPCAAAVHTGKLDSQFKALLVNSTRWQYYGTPDVRGALQMTWNTSLVKAEKVNIELWGYRETGEKNIDLQMKQLN